MPRKRKEHPDRWNNPFPTRLRLLLDEHDLSHQALANYLGVARQSVGNYCDGSVSPGLDTLVKIAKYFSVSTDFLLGITDVRTLEPDVQAACELTGLSEESIRFIQKCCTQEQNAGARKCLNAILTHPDFSAVVGLVNGAWHCAQEAQRWEGLNLSDSDAAAQELADLTNAMQMVKAHGMAICGWDECARDYMGRAGDVLGGILREIANSWCAIDEEDTQELNV